MNSLTNINIICIYLDGFNHLYVIYLVFLNKEFNLMYIYKFNSVISEDDKRSIKHFHLYHHQNLLLEIVVFSLTYLFSSTQKIDQMLMFLYHQSYYLTMEHHMSLCKVF